MSNNGDVISKMKAIHNSLTLQEEADKRSAKVERLNRIMLGIKRVGMIENVRLNGSKGRYMIIDGASWQNVCRDLKREAAPSFVLWEEGEFLSFLQSNLSIS